MHWLTHRALWSASLPQSEGNAALLNNQRRKPHPLSCPLRREISPLRSATVEMTIGAPANIVISSGGDAPVWVLEGNRFDETLSREISHQKANPVTLTLSSAAKPPQQPSRRRRVKLKNLKNPRAGGPSTFSFTALLYNPRRQPHPFF